jgi:redox-sensitive bicupin YhaK (pirin superfamily)
MTSNPTGKYNPLSPPTHLKGEEVRDGAGVKILRLFGSPATFDLTDPFLLLDFFGSNNPEDYLRGFPWHPHRGIETLTYLLKGRVDHEDSLGNAGTLRPGEIQWMTAGSGIFHQEMPRQQGSDKEMLGFQLWINLRKAEKFTKPTYRSINVEKILKSKSGKNEVKVIAGKFPGAEDSVLDSHPLSITYFDVTSNGGYIEIGKEEGFTSLIIPMDGRMSVNGHTAEKSEALVFGGKKGTVRIEGEGKYRYIYLSGQRTNEKIAWYGPMVLNDWKEVEDSLRDLQNGTFVRDKSPKFVSF